MSRKIDIPVGSRFGKLTVLDESDKNSHGEIMWLCKCRCGREAKYVGSQLRRGKALTCGKCAFGYYTFEKDTAVCSLPDNITFIIDISDYPLVSKYQWHITTSGYLSASINGQRTYLHYLLIPRIQNLLCDHVNRDKMDNRRQNLRYATPTENIRHKGIQANNTSGYIGVCFTTNKRGYRAYLTYQGKQRNLGVYGTAKEAAMARDKAVLHYFGEFAVLNFPERVCEHEQKDAQ